MVMLGGVYKEEEISRDVKRTLYSLLKDEVSKERAIKEVSIVYGIPEEFVEEFLGICWLR